MEKLDMQTKNLAEEKFEALQTLFPNAVTETIDEEGKVVKAIDKDILMQEISSKVVEGKDERYQFTWPEKRKAILASNAPISKTLRPCREESVNFDTTENLYIEGDNLEVLKLLQETYLGKVKMIYIDPPYNTGNDFVYNDDFKQNADEYLENSGQFDEEGNRLEKNLESNGRFHTDWLNMMYPRLKLARNLLSEDGVIFISIDDNEQANLKKICDEVFGEGNFVALAIHKNNSNKNQSMLIGVSTEYVLVYVKDINILRAEHVVWRLKKGGAKDIVAKYNELKRIGLTLEEISQDIKDMYRRPKYSHLSRWNKVDAHGVFIDADLSRDNGPRNYTIINPNTKEPCVVPGRGWSKTYEELLELQEADMIWYGDPDTPPRIKSYLQEDSESVMDSFWYYDDSKDTKYLNEMLGRNLFDHPKSMDMLRDIVKLVSDSDDIILDFFSGSATTAHAVMQLNAEDGGNRKFIMVQLPEETDEKSEAYKAGYKNICEIGKERIRRAGKKILEENKDKDEIDHLDIGFRVLKVDSSNMKDVFYTPEETEQTLLDSLTDNIKDDRTGEDLLFQVMLDMGISLSSKVEVESVYDKSVFVVEDGFLVACFEKDISEETVKAIAEKKPYYAVFRDAGMMSDSVATNFDQIFESISPETVRRVV